MSSIWTPGGEHPVDPEDPGPGARSAPPGGAPPGGGSDPGRAEQLSPEQQSRLEEELAAMQEELARTPASVVIANHAVGLFQLAAIHLNQRPPNLEEGRLAIDALAALVDGLEGRLGEEGAALQDGLTQLRMAFVKLRDADHEG